jgi:hypothetical protein
VPNNNSFTQLSTVFETLFKHPPSEHARVLTEKYSKLIKLDPFIQEHPAFLHMQKSINNRIDIHSSFLQAQKLSGLNFLEQYSGVSERNSFLATILSYECYTQKIMKLKLIDIIKEIDISDTAEQIPNHPYLINYIGRFIKTTILENKEASALEIKSTPFYKAAVSLIQNLQERPEEFATLIERINQGVENPIFSQIIKVIFTKQILLDIQLKIAPHLESISANEHLSLLVNTYIAFLSYTLPNTSDAANQAEGHFALNQIFYQSAAFLLNDSDPDVAAFINE